MDSQSLRRYLLELPGAIEDHPFGPDADVFKVMGKMFALLAADRVPSTVTIKLDPLHGQAIRGAFAAVRPGYHMNKDHWNTIDLDGHIPEDELLAWIDESYELVVRGLTRAQRAKLADARAGGDA